MKLNKDIYVNYKCEEDEKLEMILYISQMLKCLNSNTQQLQNFN